MQPRTIETLEELMALEGRELGASGWIEITQQQIDQFADLTSDHQWIHIDPERAAKESPYGTTVAHGFFSLSLISSLLRHLVRLRGDFQRLINYGLNKVRFPSPVPAGARIRGRFRLQSVREVEDGVQMIWLVQIEREGSEKPCVAAEWVTRAYR